MRKMLVVASALALLACEKDSKSDGALEGRVKQLEQEVAKLREVDSFVRPIMEEQKKKAEAEEEQEADPNTQFALPVAGNPLHGPAEAAVTVVEAFDFA